MSGIEIALLIIGLAIIVVSFIFSTKFDGESVTPNNNATELTERQRAAIEKQIVDIFDEKMEEQNARFSSQMDLMSTTKKKEMDEYSETILNEINRNHNEVMFLYDMLNEKKKEVTNTVRDANAVNRMARDVAMSEKVEAPSAPKTAEPETDIRETSAAEDIAAALKDTTEAPKKTTKRTTTTKAAGTLKSPAHVLPAMNPGTKKVAKNSSKNATSRVKETITKDKTEEPVRTAAGLETGNNNEKILALNKEGKSNVEIAKELGIGIGEVKLVIDLFKGGRS